MLVEWKAQVMIGGWSAPGQNLGKIGGSVEIWLQYKNYKFEIFYFFFM